MIPAAWDTGHVGGYEGYFGEHVAAVYDAHSASMFDPAVVGPAVDRLGELAGDGAALEFAIGTGRIALPLAERGVRVAGIDDSEAMLARLREKPGAEPIEAVVGDMATTRVEGEFSLVYLVFNTIFNLTTQEGQVACFENAAAHLRSGGRFVIEARVPELQRLPLGQTVLPWRADPDGMSYSRAVHGAQPVARVGLREALSVRAFLLAYSRASSRQVKPPSRPPTRRDGSRP